jgi:hypothetical protein
MLVILFGTVVSSAQAWEGKVTSVLQHGTMVAIYLSPDPGPGSSSVGLPYLLEVSDTPASKQRFAMVMTALITGQTISGYDDGCSSGNDCVRDRPLDARRCQLNRRVLQDQADLSGGMRTNARQTN